MRKVVSALVLVLLIAIAVPASAENVQVRLRVANPSYYTPVAQCTVSVPAGEDGNGIAVLEAARLAGCISSYSLTYYSIGAFVSCINGVCGDPGPTFLRYWVMREGVPGDVIPSVCAVTSYGVNDYRAAAGEELSFTFETLATGLLPAACRR